MSRLIQHGQPRSTDTRCVGRGRPGPGTRARLHPAPKPCSPLTGLRQRLIWDTHTTERFVEGKADSLDGDVALLAVLGGLAERTEDTGGDLVGLASLVSLKMVDGIGI